MSQISTENPYPSLMQRIRCDLDKNRNLQDKIDQEFDLAYLCCNPPQPSSSSSEPPPSSSSSAPLSSSSSACDTVYESPKIFDEWDWNSGVSTGAGVGVNTWTGMRNARVLTTLPGRVDSKRAKVQDNCILVNGDPLDKRAYHAQFDNDWWNPALTTQAAFYNALFFVVEIDLFKPGETVLWNHIISGDLNNNYNSFTSQTSSNTIGTRLNGAAYASRSRPSWIQNGVQRYIVEMTYNPTSPSPYTNRDLRIRVNGFAIAAQISSVALKRIVGVGVVAPIDYSANSTLNRRLLSILALQDENLNLITNEAIVEAREYLACKWNVTLQS